MIIYKATNKANDKIYIGQTIQPFSERKSRHICDAKNGSDTYFARALRKYGTDGFTWEVIHVCKDINELNKQEIYYIAYYNSFGEGGYNLTSGGENCIVSDETKQKLSIANSGENNNMYGVRLTGKNNPNYGKKMSDEQKEKISNTKIRLETSKGKNNPMYGISLCGKKNGMYGKTHTQESRQKISENHARSMLGKKHTKEAIKKMRQAKLGKKHTPKTIEKMRLSQQKYWANKRLHHG